MYKLYTYGRTRGMRVVWTLQELSLEFEEITIDLSKGEHKTPAFTKINPLQKIPALKFDNNIVLESVAICQFLVERHREPQLSPEPGSLDSAKFHQLNYFAVNELEASLWTIEKNTWFYPEGSRSPEQIAMATAELKQALEFFDHHLAPAENFILQSFSLADITIGYTLIWADSRKLLENLPRTTTYLNRLKKRAAFPHHLYEKTPQRC